jgi:putative nucleotidyltransferase with HDIG domain
MIRDNVTRILAKKGSVTGLGAAIAFGLSVTVGAGVAQAQTQVPSGPENARITVDIQLVQPITDELRQSVMDSFPELSQVKNRELADKAVTALTIGLAMSTFKSWDDVPGGDFPTAAMLVPGSGDGFDPPAKKAGQQVHMRAVGQLAVAMAKEAKKWNTKVEINEDYCLVGGILHDVGKAYEFDPVNQKRWKTDPSRTGDSAIRHPIFGIYPAILAGLPEDMVHLIASHSKEGDEVKRSLESYIVHEADFLMWPLAANAGAIDPKTIPAGSIKKFDPRDLYQ